MKVGARDTDGLLLEIDNEAEAQVLAEILDRFRSLSQDGVSRFWSIDTDHDGWPLWSVVIGQKRYVLFTRNDNGSLREVVKFSEHALAGAVADPPRLSGRDSKRKHLWARAVAIAAVEGALSYELDASVSTFQACWDAVGSVEPFPSITRRQASTPAQLAQLSPRLELRPFGRYVQLERDPAFGHGEAPVALDPGTELAEWKRLSWPNAVTTVAGQAGIVVSTLATKSRRWLKPRPQHAAAAVVVRLVRRAGRVGPVLDAQIVDPECDMSGLRVAYNDDSLKESVRRLASDLGPRRFSRLSGLSPSAAARLAQSRKPSSVAVRRALRGLRVPTIDTRSCSCGRPLFRPNATTCSKRCRDAAYRKRRKVEKAATP